MKINRQKLQTALELVKPGLISPSREVIEQTSNFAFMKGRLVTYNDEISISHPMPELSFEAAIPAEELYQLICKLKTEEIEINLEDNQILITSGKAQSGISIQTEVTLPIEEVGKIKKWEILPENFLKHLSFCVASCSKDASRPVLNCVNVNKKIMEASDGYRISKCQLSKELKLNAFLIPKSFVPQLLKFNPVEISESENQNWMHFKKENTVISCRIIDGNFPNTSKFLEVEGEQITFPDTIFEVLDRAWVFAKRDAALEEMISINFNANKCIVESNSELGWFKEEIRMRYAGEELKFLITPYLLKDILKDTKTFLVGKDRIKFAQDDWEYLTLLRV